MTTRMPIGWRRALVAASGAVLLGAAGAFMALLGDGGAESAEGALALARPAATAEPRSAGPQFEQRYYQESPASEVATGCPLPFDAIFSGGAVSPTLDQFPMRLLRAPFRVNSLTIRAETSCLDEANPVREFRTLETIWLHASQRFELILTQKEEPARISNVISSHYAQFWDSGFAFTIAVRFGREGLNVRPDPDKPGEMPPPEEALAILDEAVRQLAPGIDRACIFREEHVDWPALAEMGIGDPRPAIPANFREQTRDIVRFITPSASCNQRRVVGLTQDQFSVVFIGADGGHFSVRAYSAEGPAPDDSRTVEPGSAGWSNGRHWFNLSWDVRAMDQATALGIAKALDPGFAGRCHVTQRLMTDDEFAALRLAPQPPPGYSLSASPQRLRLEAAGPCGAAVGGPGFNLKWFLPGEADRGLIEAGAWYGPQPPGAAFVPFVEGQTLFWQDPRGYFLYVVGFKADFKADRKTLIEVARSMDPNFDEAKLIERE